MDEIPANPIDSSNPVSNFSPIKFVEKYEKDPLSKLESELFAKLKKSGVEGAEFSGIVDDEITISAITAQIHDDKFIGTNSSDYNESPEKSNDEIGGGDSSRHSTTAEERLQRKSDEDLCNTPKRERHQDRTVHERSEKYEIPESPTNNSSSLPSKRNEVVKSLSMEFEKRMASIQVSPKPENQHINTSNTANTINTINSNNSPVILNVPSSSRVMSPIRCVPQLSPVSKLNLNEDETQPGKSPKLISPSKIASVSVKNNNVDSEKIKEEIESKWSKQVEFLQFEVSTLQEKYEESIKNNSEMRTMLAEYEKTLAQFIDARRMRPDQHSSIDQLLQDKKKLEVEMQSLQISYQNLHQRYEDMKGLQEQARISDATLRQSIQVLQQELASTVRTLDNTRRAYEDKLEKMSNESKNVKEGLENELSATKAKLLKSELKISSLESAIETKTRENSELMTICDELIHKMDKRVVDK